MSGCGHDFAIGEGGESIANLRVTALEAPACFARLERVVGVQAHEYCGERCGVLSSYRADAAIVRQASQTAGDSSPHAILEVQAHVALLQQALSLAGSHKEGAADALWAGGLEVEALAVSLAAAAVEQAHSQRVEVVGVLRAALVGTAPGLGKAAHCEEAEARHAVLEDVEQHALEWLAVRRGASLSTCGPRRNSQ